MNLPSPVQAYFEADRCKDGEALLQAFAPDAVVSDEGAAFTGREAIAGWWRDVTARYQSVAEPLEATQENTLTRVRARVTGRFPGSPATLTFAFRLDDNRIAHLRMSA